MAQALTKFLDNQYIEIDGEEHKFVKGVMGIFGHGNVVGLGEALKHGDNNLKFYQGKNEQEICHAAMAYAKQKDRKEIFACTASVGPGSLNMVTAAATATANRIPVLFLPADSYADRQPDPVLQQIEHPMDPNVTSNDSFKPVSKFWDRISRPEQLIKGALNAMQVLTNPADTGAVTLALPQDVQGEAYDYPVEFFKKRVYTIDRRPISDAAKQKAVDLISGKEKPLIICGGGIKYSGAADELKDFAEKFNIPFAETQAGKGVIPANHELNLGGMGVCGTLAANKIAKDADLIIAAGTRLNDFVTSSKKAFQNPDVSMLNININGQDALKMNSLPVVADAKDALAKLNLALEEKGYKSSYKDEIKLAQAEWAEELERIGNEELEEGLSQQRVLRELNEILPEDAIVVASSGSLPSDLERIWNPKKPNTYHLEYGFSCMGYEVPGALGAKLAEPDKEVYAFIGDGAYLMGHTELYTAIQEDVKINIILFDNSGHQCIHNLQRGQGIGSFGTEFRERDNKTQELTGKCVPIDFAKNAESYGAKGYKANTIEEIKNAVEKSKNSKVKSIFFLIRPQISFSNIFYNCIR